MTLKCYRFEVRVCEEIFAKRGFGGLGPFGVIRNFCRVWKKKISLKGHSIDNSNKYKFIYVPSSSSGEKKTSSRIAGLLIFFPWKFEPGWEKVDRGLDPMWQTVVIDTFFTFWSFLVAEQNFHFRFQHPCYKCGAHTYSKTQSAGHCQD